MRALSGGLFAVSSPSRRPEMDGGRKSRLGRQDWASERATGFACGGEQLAFEGERRELLAGRAGAQIDRLFV